MHVEVDEFILFCFSWNLGYDTLEVKCMLHALNGSSMLHTE